MFVDRHPARLQLRDSLLINVRTNNLVPRFRETCTGHQTDVTTSDYRDMQAKPPHQNFLRSHIPRIPLLYRRSLFHPSSSPRSPSNINCGCRRSTFHSSRVDSSRVTSLKVSRVAALSRSTSRE